MMIAKCGTIGKAETMKRHCQAVELVRLPW